MRLADRPTVAVDVVVAAPLHQVWDAVCDINLPARFSSEFRGASWLDGASGPAVGARFLGRNEHPVIGAWETISTVSSCEPPRRWAWAVALADAPESAEPLATWGFELEPSAEGTRLRQRAQVGPGTSFLTRAVAARPEREEVIVARRLEEWRANMLATLQGIRSVAERRARLAKPVRLPGQAAVRPVLLEKR